jgi:hypothetical protein
MLSAWNKFFFFIGTGQCKAFWHWQTKMRLRTRLRTQWLCLSQQREEDPTHELSLAQQQSSTSE